MIINKYIYVYDQLTEKGKRYGACLARFIQDQKKLFRQKQLENYQEEESYSSEYENSNSIGSKEPPEKNFFVWTSLLKRTIQTVENFDPKEFYVMVIKQNIIH